MSWAEFKDLLAGIGPETSLGRAVAIRSEKDEETLKHFTPEMRRMRAEWSAKNAARKTASETASFLESMKQAFISMAGGRKDETESEVPDLRAQAEDTLQPGRSEPGSVCALSGKAVQEDI